MNESAFPVAPPCASDGSMASGYPFPEAGMTLRDYFAAKAMQAWLWTFTNSRHPTDNGGEMELASASYMLADAMLKERAKA